ncbi:MAG TPA: formate dehydrogenase subunit gamma [Ideonella sp.]|uniref:formate dehydrogenase subunit gamma n=1 Tax=Ideonella sp. TaxID=1929293 RepID=UPI002E3389CC|nr:formate dehydrogenase subunit gamma [Ideonella sp.]HEX5688056.1 formate dehydrogenase subunit gamma [Ideonella sp.]
MRRLICTVSFGLALVAAASAGSAQTPAALAASAATATAPAAFVAGPEPQPGDSNAQREKSQPGNNAPMWRAVKETGGTSSLPGAEQGVLVQPFVQYPGSRWTSAGEAWRQVRNQWLIPYGGALLFIVVLAIGLFYWRKGRLGHAENTGGAIERFTPFERAAHWSNATAFVVLAVSGLVMAFGKFLLLPVIGSLLFGWLTYALKTAHNLVGPLFVVSLIVVLLTFVRDNLPQRGDFTWLRRGGGLLGGHEVPSNRFNAGEKLVFWGGALLLGGIVAVSGLVLDKLLPGLAYLRSDMQIAHMVHIGAAVLMMALLLGHIYIGTLGMRGAYRAMRDGYVDEDWAAEHHALWLDEIRAGKIPAQRSAKPAPRPSAAPAARNA